MRRCRRPAYPTRLEVLEDPELLTRHLPAAWRHLPAMSGAIGLFLGVNLTVSAAEEKAGAAKPTARTAAVVAPIFEHGEGRGATGCVVISPPVFLSEEEALQVIRDELAKRGVTLGREKQQVTGVTIDGERFQADAADSKKRVAVEFVSEQQCQELDWARERETNREGSITISTVTVFDFPRTAKYLAEKVKSGGSRKVFFGTFYDPLSGKINLEEIYRPVQRDGLVIADPNDSEKRREAAEVTIKAESTRLLRLQVQDFVKWLQGQGVI